MNSLYLHIPYCISRCGYCDFHSSTCLDDKDKYVSALCLELEQRKDYLSDKTLGTIYFGGGTPSLLSEQQLDKIFRTIKKHFKINTGAEITLEANPDDICESYLDTLKSNGINRLSIGVQSFDNKELKLINRRHSAEQSAKAVNLAQSKGFDNISIDLIFGLPEQDMMQWRKNLEQALALGIQHISSYSLMFEEGTDFYKKRELGLIKEQDEDKSLEMYRHLIEKSKENGFIHYETSNFAKEGYYSKHNSNYWSGKAYLGVGAGAHSYDGISRRWNRSDNQQYINSILSNSPTFEIEEIDNTTAYNEYIMTGLRTIWGCDLQTLKERFGDAIYHYCMVAAKPYLDKKQLAISHNTLSISAQAVFISDKIMSDLMYVE